MDTTENSDDFYVNQEVGNQDLTENTFFCKYAKIHYAQKHWEISENKKWLKFYNLQLIIDSKIS